MGRKKENPSFFKILRERLLLILKKEKNGGRYLKVLEEKEHKFKKFTFAG